MLFERKEIRLKNEKTAILRAPVEADAQALLEHLMICYAETEFLLRYPEECKDTSAEWEQEWIRSSNESPFALVICCEIGGIIVGTCDLRLNKGRKTAHRASLGITVQKSYWNLGIGSTMLEELIAVCKAKGIEIMELDFIEGNDRARRLYETFGFLIVGELPHAIKQADGRTVGLIHMQKHV